MSESVDTVPRARKYPFVNMRLDDWSVLDQMDGRHPCKICSRSRKFFCYSCYVPVGDLGEIFPKVNIPLDIDIIKHKKEIDGKSTAVHAAILSKRVKIYTYPDIPDYSKENGVVLIFPVAKSSLTVPQLFNRKVRHTGSSHQVPKGHNIGTMLKHRVKEVLDETDEADVKNYSYDTLPIRRAVFIDSTWNQSRGIYKDERLKSLRPVVLQNRFSQFWRHQRNSPLWYLSTVEAIHQLLLEVHVNAWGLNPHYRGLDNLEIEQSFYNIARVVEADKDCLDVEAPYNGQYDNLMFFFANMYDLIHKYYDHNQLKSYRRPI